MCAKSEDPWDPKEFSSTDLKKFLDLLFRFTILKKKYISDEALSNYL